MIDPSCIVCKAQPIRRFKKRIFDSVESYIYECPSCGLVWRDPIPTAEQLENYYSSNTFRYPDKVQKEMAESQRDFILRAMSKLPHPPSFRFVEYGAGNGWLVKIMSGLPWISFAAGIEPDLESVTQAREFLRVNMYNGFMGQYPLPHDDHSEPTLVALSHVMEHLPNPLYALDFFIQTFPKHFLFIEVPDGNLEKKAIFADLFLPTSLDQHLWEFDHENLTRMLQNKGYTMICSETIGAKGFWKVSMKSNSIMRMHIDICDEWNRTGRGPGIKTLRRYARLMLELFHFLILAAVSNVRAFRRSDYPSLRIIASYQK